MDKLLFVFYVRLSINGDDGGATLSTRDSLEVESVEEAEVIARAMMRTGTAGRRPYQPLYVVVGGRGIIKREWEAE